MRLRSLIFILLTVLIFLIQVSFFSASGSALATTNLLAALVIWLVWLRKKQAGWLALLGGGLVDLWQGSLGPQLLSLGILILIVLLLQQTIATTGRFGQFLAVSAISLLSFSLLEILFGWLFNLAIFGSQGLVYSFVITWLGLFKFLAVNLLILSLLYSLGRPRPRAISIFKDI